MPTVFMTNKATNHGTLLFLAAFQRAIPFQMLDQMIRRMKTKVIQPAKFAKSCIIEMWVKDYKFFKERSGGILVNNIHLSYFLSPKSTKKCRGGRTHLFKKGLICQALVVQTAATPNPGVVLKNTTKIIKYVFYYLFPPIVNFVIKFKYNYIFILIIFIKMFFGHFPCTNSVTFWE